ncbi:MAG: chromosomal replication initiator protein DnaA [Candidatus Anoxymicrobium japonicum]|uniref:Chromosomal replication initiator protein DnaA n=1 Tax=Candidatus Anoxymicrobium japonicum TaxID=2013648 RepID=A0A2N3G583_9ACTN|nr:MAG: chromosomal replication initiator protein DnaA [Candidatus Anoxymicrobium japonicum]
MKHDVAIEEESPMAIEDLWRDVLSKLSGQVPPHIFSSIISPLKPISLDGDTFLLGAPNSFTKDIIAAKYLDILTVATSEALGESASLALTVSTPTDMVERIAVSSFPPRKNIADDTVPAREGLSSSKRYSFDNFIVGDSNKFAYHAALMVAEFPGDKYNPLFLYGGTGLGKTHLLHAIKDYAEKTSPNLRVKYVQTSTFIDEFIATITLKRDKSAFDQKYINNKIVLFDDIQALSGTDATQGKFFDIFNLLHSANSHIVLSSDRPPSEMPQLADRIRSRFEGGLLIDITPPDMETRLAILHLRARAENVYVPDDALVYIASKVKDNIRSLEGLLNRVIASAQLYGTRIDLEMVQDVLKDQGVESNKSRTPSVDVIQSLVANYYHVALVDLNGKNRSRSLVHARQVAMYLCREMTDATLLTVGTLFGNRDHSTVLHSCRKIENLLKTKRETFQEVTEITNLINKAI